MNLLSNACKFTSDGFIRIRVWVCDEIETIDLKREEAIQAETKKLRRLKEST